MRERLFERARPRSGTQARGHPSPATSLQTGRRRVPLVVVIVVPGRRPPDASRGEDRTIAQGSRRRVLVVDGYVRPSSDGPWSPGSAATQRGQIARWAAGRGWRLGRVLEEEPSSGPAEDRPLLAGAVERVESRESDGTVTARLTTSAAPWARHSARSNASRPPAEHSLACATASTSARQPAGSSCGSSCQRSTGERPPSECEGHARSGCLGGRCDDRRAVNRARRAAQSGLRPTPSNSARLSVPTRY